MPKRAFVNRLNELTPREWLKFQKSWFIHNPPKRQKGVLRHPAKYPETLAMEFISFFTKVNQVVLDPMAGTGSTLVAALRLNRHSFGVEINPTYVEIAHQVLVEEIENLGEAARGMISEMVRGDAACMLDIAASHQIPPIDYILTSPPYWDMLHMRGGDTQKDRRDSEDLDLIYSEDPNDLGNVLDYDEFIKRLVNIYSGLKPILKPGAYLTIIVKNVKKGGKIYPLAWDLAASLKNFYPLKDEKIWCQDNQRLFPFGLGNVWVSNTFHHYCLQFRNE